VKCVHGFMRDAFSKENNKIMNLFLLQQISIRLVYGARFQWNRLSYHGKSFQTWTKVWDANCCQLWTWFLVFCRYATHFICLKVMESYLTSVSKIFF